MRDAGSAPIDAGVVTVDPISSNCSDGSFDGDLVIETDQDLAQLRDCKQVGGNLTIATAKLAGLGGLENLSVVTGLVRIAPTTTEALSGVVTGTLSPPALDSLKGLNGLQSAGGLALFNLRITDLQPLANLRSAPVISIQFATSLNDLRGLENANWTSLDLEHNASLRSLDGLNGPGTGDIINISDNPKLESLAGLRRLGGAPQLLLSQLPSLKSLDGLQGLRSNTGLAIVDCDALTDLTGVGDSVELWSLIVNGNQQLSSLTGLKPGRPITMIQLSDNPNLSSLSGLTAPGDNDIQDLLLSSLPALKSLAGLEDLRTTNQLSIELCDGLVDFTGLNGLRGADTIWVNDCRGLQSFKGLDALEHARNGLQVVATPALASLQGAPRLAEVGPLMLQGTALTTLEGLGALTNVTQFVLSGNASLQNLHGFEKVTGLNAVQVDGNAVLKNLEGLHTTSLDALLLTDNPQLSDLQALNTLQSVAQVFTLQNLPALANLTGLGGLTSVGSSLSIAQNSSLTSLRGLSALSMASSVDVSGNQRLPQCEVEWLYKRINQTAPIGQNGPSGGTCPE